MQENQNKEIKQQPYHSSTKEIYEHSLLKINIVNEICSQFTSYEVLDPNVEKVSLY